MVNYCEYQHYISTLNSECAGLRSKYIYIELYREIIKNQEEQEENQQFSGRQ